MSLKFLSFLLTILSIFLLVTSDVFAQNTDSLETSNEENRIQLNNVQEILHRYEVAEHFYVQGKLDSVAKILLPYLKDRRLLRKVDKSTRAEIYRLALPLIDKIYLTEVHHAYEGDTFFPKIDKIIWKESHREDFEIDEKHKVKYSFVELKRC